MSCEKNGFRPSDANFFGYVSGTKQFYLRLIGSIIQYTVGILNIVHCYRRCEKMGHFWTHIPYELLYYIHS